MNSIMRPVIESEMHSRQTEGLNFMQIMPSCFIQPSSLVFTTYFT